MSDVVSSVEGFFQKRFDDQSFWKYLLINTIAWTIIYTIRAEYDEEWDKKIRPSWAPGSTFFTIGWLVVQYVDYYIAYYASRLAKAKQDTSILYVSDTFLFIILFFTILLFIEDFIENNERSTLVLYIFLVLFVVCWMIYLLKNGSNIAWLLLVHLFWLIYVGLVALSV